MKWLMNRWKEAVAIAALLGAITVYASNQQKAQKYDETLSQMVEVLNQPKKDAWLEGYLLNHDVDSSTADTWSRYLKEIPHEDKKIKAGIYFLSPGDLPELGLYCKYKKIPDVDKNQNLIIRDSLVILDTLWDFRSAQWKTIGF